MTIIDNREDTTIIEDIPKEEGKKRLKRSIISRNPIYLQLKSMQNRPRLKQS